MEYPHLVACEGFTRTIHDSFDSDGAPLMYGTSTQHNGMAAVAVARARYVGGANDRMANLTVEASWSIPCTVPATFHKPRPRRSQVTFS